MTRTQPCKHALFVWEIVSLRHGAEIGYTPPPAALMHEPPTAASRRALYLQPETHDMHAADICSKLRLAQ